MTSGGNHKFRFIRKRFNVRVFQRKFERWLDEWRLAGSGVVLATQNRRFLLAALLTFVIFGTLMNLFSGSTAALDLFWQVGLLEKLKIIMSGFLGLFGIGRNFLDWLLLFSVTVIQSLLIGLVVLVWQHKRASTANSDNLQSAGLAAGLAVLGTGCPTCGTTLLAPLIGTVFSTSSYALAGTVSGLLILASVIVALLTLKHLGSDAYAMIISAKYQKRNHAAAQVSREISERKKPISSSQPKSEKSHA